jgi:hypothetical protein
MEQQKIFSIENDGDWYEKLYHPFLQKDFPNYDEFWRIYIVPMTDRNFGGGIQLRDNIDALLEDLAMTHYTVYYHLGTAALLSYFHHGFFEDILFHLSSATEIVERLIFIIAKLKFQIENKDLVSELTQDKFTNKVQEYYNKKYKKDFEHFLDKGRPVNVQLHKITKVTKIFMKDISASEAFTQWLYIVGKIRHYRNVLTHNPKLGNLYSVNEIFLVPKEDKLNYYERWSQVKYRSNKDDFVKLTDLLFDYQHDLVENTNTIWKYLIDVMKDLYKFEDYKLLLQVSELKIPGIDDLLKSSSTNIISGSSYDPTKDNFR